MQARFKLNLFLVFFCVTSTSSTHNRVCPFQLGTNWNGRLFWFTSADSNYLAALSGSQATHYYMPAEFFLPSTLPTLASTILATLYPPYSLPYCRRSTHPTLFSTPPHPTLPRCTLLPTLYPPYPLPSLPSTLHTLYPPYPLPLTSTLPTLYH